MAVSVMLLAHNLRDLTSFGVANAPFSTNVAFTYSYIQNLLSASSSAAIFFRIYGEDMNDNGVLKSQRRRSVHKTDFVFLLFSFNSFLIASEYHTHKIFSYAMQNFFLLTSSPPLIVVGPIAFAHLLTF